MRGLTRRSRPLGSWFVVRGSWFVVRGSWFVVRAESRRAARRLEESHGGRAGSYASRVAVSNSGWNSSFSPDVLAPVLYADLLSGLDHRHGPIWTGPASRHH